jgi:hypothetical protein
VRLGTLLRSRLVEDGQNQERRRRSEAESSERQAAYAEALQFEGEKAQERAARAQARRVIGWVIRAEHRDIAAIERLGREAAERLRAEDIYGWVSTRPPERRGRRDLRGPGLSPDWSQLGKECWAVEEVSSGHVGDSLRAFVEAPPSEDDEADLEDEREGVGPRLTLVPSLLSGSG